SAGAGIGGLDVQRDDVRGGLVGKDQALQQPLRRARGRGRGLTGGRSGGGGVHDAPRRRSSGVPRGGGALGSHAQQVGQLVVGHGQGGADGHVHVEVLVGAEPSAEQGARLGVGE